MLEKFEGKFEDETLTGFWKKVWRNFRFMQDQSCFEGYEDTRKRDRLKEVDFTLSCGGKMSTVQNSTSLNSK
jgi:hypothetical protein